jgi:hypothetical protein
MEEHVPSKTMYLKANSAPWFDHRCYEARRIKIRAWLSYSRQKNDASYQHYRDACRTARTVFSTAKLTYYKSMAAGIIDQPASSRHYWSIIKTAMGVPGAHPSQPFPIMESR